jgi:hypothetical protein
MPPYLNIHADWTPTGSLDGVFVNAEHPTSAEHKGGSAPPRFSLLLLYAIPEISVVPPSTPKRRVHRPSMTGCPAKWTPCLGDVA